MERYIRMCERAGKTPAGNADGKGILCTTCFLMALVELDDEDDEAETQP
jgi:hypothetical protein